MDNKYSDNEIKVEQGFAKKFENFWYYHKWKVLVSLFAAFVLAVCVYSCISKPKTDVVVLYSGPFNSSSAIPEINKNLTDGAPDGVVRNGISINVLTVYTEEQWTKLAKEEVDRYIAEDGGDFSKEEREKLIKDRISVYKDLTADNSKAFGEHLGIGSYAICFVDPSVYESYKETKVFANLSDIFGSNVPGTANDEFTVKLADTHIYKSNPNGIGQLPEDTLICLRVEPFFSGCGGGSSGEYQKAIQVFKILVQ